MEHLRRSLRFGHARLNASLAILPVRKTGGRGLGTIGVAENCVAVPFPAVRHVTYWLDRPQPAPGWGRFSESRNHLVERRGLRLSASLVCPSWATEEESKMPVLLLWAVPAVIVVGGVGYYLVRAVH
jgi:hypothetical protein